jgi:hypothetical protein
MQLVGSMTPTGYQDPPPKSGPRGVANLDIDVPHSIIHIRVDFADTGPAIPGDPNGPCPEYWPSNGSRLYVVAGDKIIGGRQLPPPTCSTITDDWPGVPSQVMQAIVANPSNAIVYVEAPPNTLPRESLPGGVVLNGASPWARLQPPPTSGGEANL